MASRIRRLMVASMGSASLLAATVALAWTQEAPIDVTVHSHSFHTVKVSTDDCTIKTSLWFRAPQEGYSSRYANQNHFRFRARIGLSEDKLLVSPVFSNRGAGERVYRFEQDTTSDGCWAKTQHKVFRVDVDGCRNRACEIPAFK
ncbi:MAG: hypothetical protein JW940_07095 [Polyangiaceae bacterium]|nr:hypothetical protein [Polyangiaceae bacterium]